MRGLLICLPLCLLLAPAPPPAPRAAPAPAEPSRADAVADRLPGPEEMRRLARVDPVEFLRSCHREYQAHVRGYTTLLHKKERIGDRDYPPELIEASVRVQPWSVLLRWRKGMRMADRALYVKGEHDEMMLVRPAGLLRIVGVVQRDPTGEEARKSGRYPITEFGLEQGLLRNLRSWTAARDAGRLRIEVQGEIAIDELPGCTCLVLHRPRFEPAEADGVTSGTFYYDTTTWLQIGAVLHDKDERLIASYYFQHVRLNPEFPADLFTEASVRK